MAGFNSELNRWLGVHRAPQAPAPVPVARERRQAEEIKPKVERRMAAIDALTPEQRMVVHEHGWNLVRTFLDHGVTNPRSMRGLINAVMHNCINRCDRPEKL